jgi:DNA-binding response OmpR family regulator
MTVASILVVEDEENVRQGLEEILMRAGYRVKGAGSGEEAINLAGSEKFDLAVLDLKLNGIDGIAVLKKLRQISPGTVVIVLTAHASLETAVEALRLGAHDYLFKPSSAAELLESIRRGLSERKAKWHDDLMQQLHDVAGHLDTIRTTLMDWEHMPAAPEADTDQGRFLQRGDLVVDYMRHLITLNGHLLDLSPTEFNLLSYLIQQSPRVVAAQELIDKVQEYETDTWEAKRLVRQYIYRLRQKVFEATGRDNIISTVRGIGYSVNEKAL